VEPKAAVRIREAAAPTTAVVGPTTIAVAIVAYGAPAMSPLVSGGFVIRVAIAAIGIAAISRLTVRTRVAAFVPLSVGGNTMCAVTIVTDRAPLAVAIAWGDNSTAAPMTPASTHDGAGD